MLLQNWFKSIHKLIIGSEVAECVDHFTYFGSFISSGALVSDDVSANLITHGIDEMFVCQLKVEHTAQTFVQFCFTTVKGDL